MLVKEEIKSTAVFWTSCQWDSQAMPGDPLRGKDSTSTAQDEDTRFCCEAITMINKGAASTSCATGKNTSYPYSLLLASHGKGIVRSDTKIPKLALILSSDIVCHWNEKARENHNLATELLVQLYCLSGVDNMPQGLLKCYSRLKTRNLQIQALLMLVTCHQSYPDGCTNAPHAPRLLQSLYQTWNLPFETGCIIHFFIPSVLK